MSVAIQLIPNQTNRRSTVQWYFPLAEDIAGDDMEMAK
jgi:hypothetical protein